MSSHCVYTIAHPDVLARAIVEGVGVLEEGSPWKTAEVQFREAQLRKSEYLLLLGDAVHTNGVEWVALVESIVLDGRRTTVRFKYPLPLRAPIPLRDLRKASDGQPLADSYVRPYVPCIFDDADARSIVRMLKKRGKELENVAAQDAVSLVTTTRWREAIRNLAPQISAAQRAMLIQHAHAPGRTSSKAALAEQDGRKDVEAAMLEYDALCSKVAAYFGAAALRHQIESIATFASELDDDRHWQWTLREPLVEALVLEGWIEPGAPELEKDVEPLELAAARLEIEEDPTTREAPETVRQALVYARIGQGEYRRRLEKIWSNNCALTGVRVREALTASHILSWSDANNEQRLDGYNGLLLAASVDRLFDSGLISFDEKGKLLKKARLADSDLRSLGITPESSLRHLHARHLPYLAMHRDKYGFKTT